MIKQREFSLIAHSYAQALFNTAQKQGLLKQAQNEAQALTQVGEASSRVKLFLGNPRVSTEVKLQYLDKGLGGRISAPLLRVLKLMVQRERLAHLRDTLDLFIELVERSEGIYPASLASAADLPATDKQRLQAALERFTGHQLKIAYYVDPKLIGGLVFRFRDVLIDSSLASGLDQLRRRMLGTTIN